MQYSCISDLPKTQNDLSPALSSHSCGHCLLIAPVSGGVEDTEVKAPPMNS